MTSEEFAKWFVRPGGTYPTDAVDDSARNLMGHMFTLAKDYLALLSKQQSTEHLSVENYKAVLEAREILELQETVSLSFGAHARMSELRTLREQMKELQKAHYDLLKKQPVPMEYTEEWISNGLYETIRSLGVTLDVARNRGDGFVVRYPKEPK